MKKEIFALLACLMSSGANGAQLFWCPGNLVKISNYGADDRIIIYLNDREIANIGMRDLGPEIFIGDVMRQADANGDRNIVKFVCANSAGPWSCGAQIDVVPGAGKPDFILSQRGGGPEHSVVYTEDVNFVKRCPWPAH